MNRRYVKGRRFEYRVRDFLRSHGWVVIRSAGSKVIDLVAMKNGNVLLIECKTRDYIPNGQKNRQESLAAQAGAEYFIVTPKTFPEFKKIIVSKYG